MASITGTKKKETLVGTKFDDTIFGLGGNDTLKGLAGNDKLDGGTGNDKLFGGDGKDTLLGGKGDDLLDGGKGDDKLLDGGAGRDTILGGLGKDNIKGGAGDDVLEGGAGADKLDGGAGIDTASYEHAKAGVTAQLLFLADQFPQSGDAAGDTFINIENLRGTNFNDLLVGNHSDNLIEGLNGDDFIFAADGNDTLMGGAGNDFLEGAGGADILNGGAGTDWATYEHSGNGVTALMIAINGFINAGEATGDTYNSIENLRGSDFQDFLVGDNAANTIEGRSGDDFIAGAGGVDTLTGGTGADTFIYGPLSEIGDTITDFDTAVDKIAVLTPTSTPNTGGFVPGHALGAIDATELIHGTIAVGAIAQFLIAANGDLFYDNDGTDPNAQILVAHLTGINAANFASGNIIVL